METKGCVDELLARSLHHQDLASSSDNCLRCHAANDCFYRHEWACHGTCSGQSQVEYITAVLNLNDQYPIQVHPFCASLTGARCQLIHIPLAAVRSLWLQMP